MNTKEFMVKMLWSPLVCIIVLIVGIAYSSTAVPWTARTEQITALEAQVANLEKQVQASNARIDAIYGEDAGKVVGHGIVVGTRHTGEAIAHPFVVAWNWTGEKCGNGYAKVKGWFKKNPDAVKATAAIATIQPPAPTKK